jgi:hypothetical protein
MRYFIRPPLFNILRYIDLASSLLSHQKSRVEEKREAKND